MYPNKQMKKKKIIITLTLLQHHMLCLCKKTLATINMLRLDFMAMHVRSCLYSFTTTSYNPFVDVVVILLGGLKPRSRLH